MQTVESLRDKSTDNGTLGMWHLDDGTQYHSLELPWRDNETGKSCIPIGTYTCKWLNSPKHGWCYHLVDVPGRSFIEVHSANYGGDVDKGRVSELLGCIALGLSVGVMYPDNHPAQMAILSSKAAIAAFNEKMQQQDFMLVINNAEELLR